MGVNNTDKLPAVKTHPNFNEESRLWLPDKDREESDCYPKFPGMSHADCISKMILNL